jgi:hypothetical protein
MKGGGGRYVQKMVWYVVVAGSVLCEQGVLSLSERGRVASLQKIPNAEEFDE